MGEKRPSIRTLDDGYKVIHSPPDDKYPEGKQVLIPGQSKLRERLIAAHAENKAQLRAKHERHHELVRVKRASLAAHPAVPPEKRHV